MGFACRLLSLASAVLLASSARAVDPALQKRTVSIPIQAQPAREVGVSTGPAVPVAALAFHPEGKLLATAGYREILLWDLEAARLDRRLGTGRIAGNIRALAFSPDGRTLAVADGVPGVSGAVRLIDVASGEASDILEPAKDEIASVAFHPKGQFLAVGGPDGTVRAWSLAERKTVATLKAQNDSISTVAFSPDGRFLASGSGDRTLQVWDAVEWKPLVQLPQMASEPVTGAAFSPDGESLAFLTAGENERAVRVWRTEFAPEPKEGDPNAPRLRNGRRVTRPLDLWTCSPMAVAWAKGLANHPNAAARTARLYVACTDKMVRVLNNTGNFLATLNGHQDWVYAVAVSPDGLKVASGSGDGTVKIWNRLDGALMATLVQLAARADEWAMVTPRGFFTASTPAALDWRGMPKPAAAELAGRLRNSDAVRNILAGRPPVPAAAPKGSK